jgi:hypothetical protein
MVSRWQSHGDRWRTEVRGYESKNNDCPVPQIGTGRYKVKGNGKIARSGDPQSQIPARADDSMYPRR